MKILIVNELLISGGAEQSCLKMKKILEKENEVVYLNFDNDFEKKIEEVDNTNGIVNIKLGNIKINKFIFNYFLYRKIRKKIKEINPDKIILNNLISSPITQLKAMKGFDVYQIIRDYYAVCPKATSIKLDNTICEGYKFENCYKTCGKTLKMKVRLYQLKRVEKIRKEIIKKLISPSEKLNEYLVKFGYNSCFINNPIEITKESQEDNFVNLEGTKKYVYLGAVNEIKGIYKFLDAYNEFSKDKDVQFDIIGKCSEDEDKKIIDEHLRNNKKINYLGYKSHKEVVELVRKYNFIVVPSLWIENYPTTALEGMLYKCLVLGSNRGGIPEIIGNKRGILFDILDSKSILNSLNESYNMNENEYIDRINKSYEYVINNNSFENYYKNIINVICE